MLPVLLLALLAAPLYWLVVPARLRRDAATFGSLDALGAVDLRLPILLLVLALALQGAGRLLSSGRWPWTLPAGLLLLALLFVWNKLGSAGSGALPSQGGLVLVGVSYLVLKAAAYLIDAARRRARESTARELLGWLAFLPTYPAGPIEAFSHFQPQRPSLAGGRLWLGLERILFGLVKAVVLSQALASWAGPVLREPAAAPELVRLLAVYALTLRFYLDFSGYSDLAIGVAAVFGFEVQENFQSPLVRRNLVQLWQRWHMTLTAWLRLYLFIPLSRALIRRSSRAWEAPALVLAQLTTMAFCGLWHGLGWGFLLWGGLQGIGLAWVGIGARTVGRRLPPPFRAWWRTSPLAYGLSTLLTFHYFAFSTLFVVTDVGPALHTLWLLAGA